MKLNLMKNFDENELLTGYVNVCPNAPPNHKECNSGDYVTLDSYCDDAEASEILALDVIDFLNPQVTHVVLDNWVKKLGHSGKLIIGGVETYSVCKAASLRAIDIGNLNFILRSNIDNPFGARKFTYNIEDVVNLMKSKGLVIRKQSIADLKYVVVGERL